METIRKGYPELLKKIDSTRLSFMHESINDSIWDHTPEEREAFWEYMYAQPGFGFWMSNYKEILVDRKANALVGDFVAKKIRQRVKDPWTADKLIPKTHGGYTSVPAARYCTNDWQVSVYEDYQWSPTIMRPTINQMCALSIC